MKKVAPKKRGKRLLKPFFGLSGRGA